jgi:protein gp37
MENSNISWTDHTFNPWIGCARVSPGCTNCYAEARNDRYGEGLWGKNAPRRITSDANWRKPLKWDRDAAATGRPAFVFCASLADVFEDRADLEEPRVRLWRLIADTPNLVWMLLTKRPENVLGMVPRRWIGDDDPVFCGSTLGYVQAVGQWPSNVWIGTTVEDQARADERVPTLARIPAPVRFLSCEPLLESVDLIGYLPTGDDDPDPPIDWVICGGESGPKHRPLDLAWARTLRDQCRAYGVPFWFKQVGGNIYIDGVAGGAKLDGTTYHERPEP